MATCADTAVRITKPRAVPRLVELLGSDNVKLQTNAALVLTNLASNVRGCGDLRLTVATIAEANAIPALVGLLGSEVAAVQKQAEEALGGLIVPLVAMLG
eukprot:5057326-Prymnesium_polylepis.1